MTESETKGNNMKTSMSGRVEWAQGHLVDAIFQLTAAHTKLVRGVSGENSSHNSYDVMSSTYLPSKDKK